MCCKTVDDGCWVYVYAMGEEYASIDSLRLQICAMESKESSSPFFHRRFCPANTYFVHFRMHHPRTETVSCWPTGAPACSLVPPRPLPQLDDTRDYACVFETNGSDTIAWDKRTTRCRVRERARKWEREGIYRSNASVRVVHNTYLLDHAREIASYAVASCFSATGDVGGVIYVDATMLLATAVLCYVRRCRAVCAFKEDYLVCAFKEY